MAHFIFDVGVSGVSGVSIMPRASQGGGRSLADVTRLRRGDRVRARKDICHTHLSAALVMKGARGTVESVYRTTQKAKIRWDGGLVFLCRVNELEIIDSRPAGNMVPRTLTKSQMLAFASIFDLLSKLGFEEDTEEQCMLDRGSWFDTDDNFIGERRIDFEQIGGRTVAEFVREGLQQRFLLDYVTEEE